MAKKPRPSRYKEHWTILLIENDANRQQWIETHSPGNVRYRTIRRGQIGLEVITHMRPNDYSALMLDCDLDEGLQAGAEADFNGVEIAKLLVRHAPSRQPVLVLSHNGAGAARMVMVLESNGFDVTRIPFQDLTEEKLREWLMEVEEELGIEWT